MSELQESGQVLQVLIAAYAAAAAVAGVAGVGVCVAVGGGRSHSGESDRVGLELGQRRAEYLLDEEQIVEVGRAIRIVRRIRGIRAGGGVG